MSGRDPFKIAVILRHENSLQIVENYAKAENLGDCTPIVLDRIQRDDETPAALDKLAELFHDNAKDVGVVIVGTKVYDQGIDNAQGFVPFLDVMIDKGLPRNVPIIATHLSDIDSYMQSLTPDDVVKISEIYTRNKLYFVENDNIGLNGMTNLGSVIKHALGIGRHVK